MGPGFPSGHNLTGATPAAGYTIFDFADVIDSYTGIRPVLGTCFSTSNMLDLNQSYVDECARIQNYCCYNLTAHPLPEVSHVDQ